MRSHITLIGALTLTLAGCEKKQDTTLEARATAAVEKRKLFLDVHYLGPGKVTAKAVAEAHQRDLATQGKYGVDLWSSPR